MTDIELISLGLVNEGLRYGYQIEAEIEKRNIRDWANIGFSSIYYSLAKLEKQGLVSSSRENSALGPKRKIFTITDEGKRVMANEALYRLEQRLPLPHSFYIALSLLPHIDQKAAKKALDKHVTAIRARQEQLEKNLNKCHPPLAEAMFDLGQHLTETEKTWLEDFNTKLGRFTDTE